MHIYQPNQPFFIVKFGLLEIYPKGQRKNSEYHPRRTAASPSLDFFLSVLLASKNDEILHNKHIHKGLK